MPGGLDAVVAAIDSQFNHQHFQTQSESEWISISFAVQGRFFRVRVTSEYDQDYGTKTVKKLDQKEFAEALRNTPDGNLTVTRTGFLNR